jgi:hypothetical protein
MMESMLAGRAVAQAQHRRSSRDAASAQWAHCFWSRDGDRCLLRDGSRWLNIALGPIGDQRWGVVMAPVNI